MQIYIGSSGWLYGDWVGKFYPEDLKDIDKLTFLSKHFSTVEINSTFYHMPPPKTFERWHSVVNSKFRYSVKFSRFITRTKRLVLDEDSKPFIKEFLNRTSLLKSRLAIILFQLPPSLKFNLKTLDSFLKFITSYSKQIRLRARFAVEFRHKSWFDEETYSVLKKYNTAFVIGDSTRYPNERVVTGDMLYIRMHGPGRLFASKYSNKQLKELHSFIKSNKKVKRCYVYFNNDFYGYAVENARYLKKLFKS
jgi:uncharacterized protein YecE (DUF72 family)